MLNLLPLLYEAAFVVNHNELQQFITYKSETAKFTIGMLQIVRLIRSAFVFKLHGAKRANMASQ